MPQFFADPADLAACRAMLCSGSRSFFAASLLLPRQVRDAATALYAFCREADDAIDLGSDQAAALANLYNRLDAAYEGEPYPSPVDRAFAAVVVSYQIPKMLPAALIEGLSWDLQGRRYETFVDLTDYAARVAGAVGVMMAIVMGVRDTESLARAADLGVAMQLTNIARDVGEDARAGRLFLPRVWLADGGIDEELFLAAPEFSDALGSIVKRLLAEADILYGRAHAGIMRLPRGCRVGIGAARQIYAAIGADIAESSYDSVTRRAHVSGFRKMRLAFAALPDMLAARRHTEMPALPATQYLVDAASVPMAEKASSGVMALFDIFERLERSQRESMRSERRMA